MKKYLIFLIFLSTDGYAQSPAYLGVHGLSSPAVAQELNAQIVRESYNDYQIKNAILDGNTRMRDNARQLDSLGIRQVISLTWPDTTTDDDHDQRVPAGTDSLEVFQYLDIFLNETGPYIDYIQISQEPLGLTAYDLSKYPFADVLKWWRTVVLFIRDRQTQNSGELGHIKIITGGINGIHKAVSNPDSYFAHSVDSVIAFGEKYCDAIDLHLHVTDLSMGRENINYIRQRTDHLLTCTEWSQSRAAWPEGTNWLYAVNTVFSPPHPFADLTNKQIIDSAYSSALDSAEWKALIATSPFTPGFIPDFYAVMDSNCFEFSCYGGVYQYGNPSFDWSQLYANKTVLQKNFRNDPFYSEFTELSHVVSGGSYSTNCTASGRLDHHVSSEDLRICPNPFCHTTTIVFENDSQEIYTLNIYDVSGAKVRTIGNISSGRVVLKREDLGRGIYFLRLQSKNRTHKGRIVVL